MFYGNPQKLLKSVTSHSLIPFSHLPLTSPFSSSLPQPIQKKYICNVFLNNKKVNKADSPFFLAAAPAAWLWLFFIQK